mgnify:CR=1 FL=1|jgi:hypothetical protein|tara:strand:+ start:591 stop:1196 length:606 start_codon:yes stop_codon:yes gene_type:complete
MKKLLLLPLAALFLNSCSQGPKNGLEEQESIAKNIESGQVYDYADYNDGLLAEATLVDVKLAMLQDLDAKDVSAEEMEAACIEAMDEYDRVINALNNISPYGLHAEEFKQSVIKCLKIEVRLFNMYSDYADLLAIPDIEWAEEEAVMWDETYSAIWEDYLIANDEIASVQEEYSRLNGMPIGGESQSGVEIYEESIEPAEL